MEERKFASNYGRNIGMEESIKHGLAWLLGGESLSRAVAERKENVLAAIPVARKIHALSSWFVLGGDIYLHEEVEHFIKGMQDLYGDFVEKTGNCFEESAPVSVHGFRGCAKK